MTPSAQGHGSPPDTPVREEAREATVCLAGGRRLGYAQYGDPHGRPLLYFHGISRLEARAFHDAANSLGIRIIAIDRPGMGLSDYARGRRLLDWPGDVLAVAEALGLDRFAVVGVSAGGPYAACCAYAIPERLSGVGIVGGLAPPDADLRAQLNKHQRKQRSGMTMLGKLPVLTRLVAAVTARQVRRPGGQSEGMAAVDQALIAERPAMGAAMAASFAEAFRGGTRGFAQDLRVFGTRSWGFAPESIATPVHLWHGELDENVFVANGRHLAATIPDCRAVFLPDEGHLLFADHAHEILTAVAPQALEPSPQAQPGPSDVS